MTSGTVARTRKRLAWVQRPSDNPGLSLPPTPEVIPISILRRQEIAELPIDWLSWPFQSKIDRALHLSPLVAAESSMAVSYTCPNPDCGVTLNTPNRVAVGKSVKCPRCQNPFVPEPPGNMVLEQQARPKGQPEPAVASAPPSHLPFADDDEESAESIRKGYGVVKESEAEVKESAKKKPKFTEVQDKFKKSARGPAQGLLVMPSNLLLGAGILLAIASVVYFIIGMWPLVFNDAPPGEEELDEAVFGMLMGVLGFVWAAMICYGASQMQELGSYIFSMLGAVMGIPLLVGIFAIVMLQNPKVKAGFEEAEAGPDEDDEDEDEEYDDTDEPDDDDDNGQGGSTTSRKVAKKIGRGLLKGVLGGEDDGDDDDE